MDASDPRREDLERSVLGAKPELTAQEVADAAGVTRDEAQRLWRALGFPDAGDAVAFTADDLDALRLVQVTIEQGDLDTETATRLTRAVGHTMARLADWQVSTLAEHVEDHADDGTSRLASALGLSQEVAPSRQRSSSFWSTPGAGISRRPSRGSRHSADPTRTCWPPRSRWASPTW